MSRCSYACRWGATPPRSTGLREAAKAIDSPFPQLGSRGEKPEQALSPKTEHLIPRT